MPEKVSTDYHDYVIRDGKLVGEFEAMYRNSADVPWHQDDQAQWMDLRLTTELLRDVSPFAELHDLGCGLGYYLDLMLQRVGATDSGAFGYDISETACAKARQLFPHARFAVLDLTSKPGSIRQVATQSTARRLFMIRGTLWYVFPQLYNVIQNIRSRMGDHDSLLVVQNFPPLEKPFVGKDVIPDHLALIRHFSSCFRLQRHVWYEDRLKTSNDNWFIGLFTAG